MSSTSGEFCPRCGDAVADREEPLPGRPRERDAVLCDACYLEDFDLVDAPERIEVRVCSACGAVHRGNRWVDVDARDYTDVAVDEVSESLGVHLEAREVRWGVEPEQLDENTVRMHCEFTGVVRGVRVDEATTVPVKISRGSCDRCGRIAGDYYASTVQIRAEERTPTAGERTRAREIAEELVAEREADGDREAFVSEVGQVEDGLDVKLSTNKLGRAVAARVAEALGGGYEEYPTLVTEDEDGNEVYRVTYAVRLPRYSAGELVDFEDGDGPVLVTGARSKLKGVRLATGRRYEVPAEDAPEGRRLGSRDDAAETTVVAVEDDHAVQVLDPETYEAKTVPRPDFFDPDAETTPVVRHRNGLHLVPETADPPTD